MYYCSTPVTRTEIENADFGNISEIKSNACANAITYQYGNKDILRRRLLSPSTSDVSVFDLDSTDTSNEDHMKISDKQQGSIDKHSLETSITDSLNVSAYTMSVYRTL